MHDKETGGTQVITEMDCGTCGETYCGLVEFKNHLEDCGDYDTVSEAVRDCNDVREVTPDGGRQVERGKHRRGIGYWSDASDIYEKMAGDMGSFKRHWGKVTPTGNTVGSRSGGWDVRKEHEGDRLGPPFHEVAVYVEKGHNKREVARWPLDELPNDPTDEIAEVLDL